MPQCFECGRKSWHWHHVIPASMGGKKKVPLCERCHGKIHGLDFSQHSNLIKAALKLRKMAGLPLGRPPLNIDKRVLFKLKSLYKRGASLRQMQMITGIKYMWIHRYLKTWREQNERRIGV